MRQTARWVFLFITRLLLSLHYRIEIDGADAGRKFKRGIVAGIGHTSYDDPPIVMSVLARFGIYPRPVVYSKMYDALRWVMPLVGGFRIESTSDGASSWKTWKIKNTVASIKKAIADNGLILIYPSGQTKGQERESLGGKSSLCDILRDHPETPVLAVNIYGLWGSLYSRYWTRGKQVLSRRHRIALLRKYPLHFIFRRIKVTLVFKEMDLSSYQTARAMNQALEDQYNERPDPVIPGREEMHVHDDFVASHTHVQLDEADVDPVIYKKIVDHLALKYGVDRSLIDLDSDLVHQCGLDSLGIVEMITWIGDTFSQDIDEGAKLEMVRDLVAAAQGYLSEVDAGHSKPHDVPEIWNTSRKARRFPDGAKTLFEAFVMTARYQGWGAAAMADERFGVLTYRQVLERTIMFARIIRKYPEDAIGVMLPASTMATITLFAILLSGKKAVLLNWTGGQKNLDHCIKMSGVRRIFSSDVFLDRANVPLMDETASMIMPLENMRAQVGISGLVMGKMLARLSPMLSWYFGTKAQPEDIAVILFTSGSEKAPKGVPLSHRNILSNVRGAMHAIGGAVEGRLLGFLPVFHSFGLSLVTLLCLVGGVPTLFEADPKRFKHIVRQIKKWNIQMLPGTAGLITSILDAADQVGVEHLASLDVIMTGAQKTPEVLKDRIRKLGKKFVEGYGMTEGSPLVTMTRIGEPLIGVGRPIDDTEVLIVDLETGQPVADGMQGRILVHGPGIFAGYLAGEKAAFVDIDGKRYYVPGDLGFMSNGCLTITGRESRFGKDRSGEMINYTEIEDVLVSAFPALSDMSGPRVAISAGKDRTDENKDPRIMLCTIDVSITVQVANTVLRDAGLHRRCFVSCRIVLTEIPMLGGGMKVAHKSLPNPDAVDESVLEVA
jgi:long-chain-fatty-acid--[acyl-carrier-protein] ligase